MSGDKPRPTLPSLTLWLRLLVKLQYIVGPGLVEMAISTNQMPTIYYNFYENMCPGE